jgi:hypothetical protein
VGLTSFRERGKEKPPRVGRYLGGLRWLDARIGTQDGHPASRSYLILVNRRCIGLCGLAARDRIGLALRSPSYHNPGCGLVWLRGPTAALPKAGPIVGAISKAPAETGLNREDALSR